MITTWDLSELVSVCKLQKVPREATHMPPLRNSYSATRYYRHDMSTMVEPVQPATPVTLVQSATVEVRTINIFSGGRAEGDSDCEEWHDDFTVHEDDCEWGPARRSAHGGLGVRILLHSQCVCPCAL